MKVRYLLGAGLLMVLAALSFYSLDVGPVRARVEDAPRLPSRPEIFEVSQQDGTPGELKEVYLSSDVVTRGSWREKVPIEFADETGRTSKLKLDIFESSAGFWVQCKGLRDRELRSIDRQNAIRTLEGENVHIDSVPEMPCPRTPAEVLTYIAQFYPQISTAGRIEMNYVNLHRADSPSLASPAVLMFVWGMDRSVTYDENRMFIWDTTRDELIADIIRDKFF